MSTYRLDLEYQGTAYRGWQAQKNAQTVAGKVTDACRHVFGVVHELQAAGRTDSGVHALNQVCHLKAPSRPGGAQLLHRINDQLPKDIAATHLQMVDDAFHARQQALERVYLYQILNRRSAFAQNEAFWVKDALNASAMAKAAVAFEGHHDFAAFCEADPEKPAQTKIQVKKVELASLGGMIVLRFRARHFLWKMVRRMTGALIEVGRGRAKPEAILASLAQPDARWAPFTAPPCGLYLERVLYKGERFESALRPVHQLPS
jgi:tRNA pseudouridine38-40 synthase